MQPLGNKLIIKPQKDNDKANSTGKTFVVVNQDSDVQRGEVIAVSEEVEKIKTGQIVIYYTGRYPKHEGNDIVDSDSVIGIA